MASLAGVGWPQAVADISRFIESADFENAGALCEELKIEGPRSYFFSKEVLVVWTMQNWNTLAGPEHSRQRRKAPGPVATPILGDFLETPGPRARKKTCGSWEGLAHRKKSRRWWLFYAVTKAVG